MSTDLLTEEDGTNFSLIQFYGGEKRGVMYQITQQRDGSKDFFHYVHVSKDDLTLMLLKVLEAEKNL